MVFATRALIGHTTSFVLFTTAGALQDTANAVGDGPACRDWGAAQERVRIKNHGAVIVAISRTCTVCVCSKSRSTHRTEAIGGTSSPRMKCCEAKTPTTSLLSQLWEANYRRLRKSDPTFADLRSDVGQRSAVIQAAPSSSRRRSRHIPHVVVLGGAPRPALQQPLGDGVHAVCSPREIPPWWWW